MICYEFIYGLLERLLIGRFRIRSREVTTRASDRTRIRSGVRKCEDAPVRRLVSLGGPRTPDARTASILIDSVPIRVEPASRESNFNGRLHRRAADSLGGTCPVRHHPPRTSSGPTRRRRHSAPTGSDAVSTRLTIFPISGRGIVRYITTIFPILKIVSLRTGRIVDL